MENLASVAFSGIWLGCWSSWAICWAIFSAAWTGFTWLEAAMEEPR